MQFDALVSVLYVLLSSFTTLALHRMADIYIFIVRSCEERDDLALVITVVLSWLQIFNHPDIYSKFWYLFIATELCNMDG